MNVLWFAPLAAGVLGAVALCISARRASREVAVLRRAAAPLRTARTPPGRPRRSL
ncbi:MAG: hypothetical protein ACRDYY_15060 [Acidimicrobiales bacterium]